MIKLRHLFYIFLIGFSFITLSSCQNFSPKDPNVTQNNPQLETVTPKLEAFDLTAENWEKLQGEGINLSLPKSYRGGNPTRDLLEIESALSNFGEGYSQRLQAIKQNLDNTVFLAFDTRSFEPNALTNVNIIQESFSQTETSLTDYLAQAEKQLQSTHQLEQQIVISDNESSFGRIVANVTTDQGRKMKQLFYFQPQNDKIFITTYTTPASEFNARLPNFEKSIASLKITKDQ